MTKRCETCREYLGGGSCNLSMEMECRDGGGFEAWEYSGKIRAEEPAAAPIREDHQAKTTE